ncbi:MAG: nucleotide sugar dehydrogenase [Polyangiaceae bacterium]|nr:nucleotide sugar dehydrogenase [Polyangiaceae bacterium]
MGERIAVIGLGYVGLPVALAFGRKFPNAIGFDIDTAKVAELRRGCDRNHEVPEHTLRACPLTITSDPADLAGATFYVIAVPTPVDQNKVPDLSHVIRASETVGKVLSKGDVVVYESTVYPGVTEEICGPILAKTSGLTQGVDFKLGYSPERINPGDKEHTLERIMKVVSGEDAEALERVANTYREIIDAGIHRAPSIKVAEAAKVIENTQRDINIALMNELSLIFDRIGIRTSDVLDAAGTKWNFLKFRPGLVGGHCVGTSPYFLATKAQQHGYQPEVVLAGRRINDNMGHHVATRLVKLLVSANIPVRGARVGILGITFKENVSDVRNSKVPGIVDELREFGIDAKVSDALANAAHAAHDCGITLTPLGELTSLDALVIAVAHAPYVAMGEQALLARVKEGGVLVDLTSMFRADEISPHVHYWSL